MCKFFTSFFREECSGKGGTNDGSCASGFGVCCKCKSDIKYQNRNANHKFVAVEEACGSSKSENNTILGLLTNYVFYTYIYFKNISVQASVTTLASPCTYTVCPCSSNICRIRYDFTVSN